MNALPNKQIIRTGFIKFSTIFLVLIVSYTYLFLDQHLGSSLKKGLENIHGAQVDVIGLKTKLFRGMIHIENIQFTNKKKPEQNITEIKKISIQFLIDALLRAKVVIENISLEDVLVDTRRDRPGVVFPEAKSEVLNNLSRAGENQISTIKEENNQNPIGVVINLIEGKSLKDSSAGITSNLQAEKLINQLETNLLHSEKQWKKDREEIQKRVAKYNNFKIDKDPKKALKQIKQVNKDYKALKNDFNTYQRKVKTFKVSINKTKKAIKQDFNTIKTSSALPGINIQDQLNNLLKEYLMIQFNGLIQSAREIENKIPKSAKEKIQARVQEKQAEQQDKLAVTRSKNNVVYPFPNKKSYPFFWLKKFDINVSKENQYIINGKIEHLSSNSTLINKFPHAKVQINGKAIPGQSIKAEMSMDNEKRLQFSGALGPFIRSDLSLIDSTDFSWRLQRPRSVSTFNGSYHQGKVNIKINQLYEKFTPLIKMKKGRAKEIISKVIQGISPIRINTTIFNTLQSPRFSVNSNVGGLFESNLKKEISSELSKKLKKKKKDLQKKVDQQVVGIEKKYNSIQQKLLSKFNIKKFNVQKQKDSLLKNTLKKIDPKKINLKKLKLDKIF